MRPCHRLRCTSSTVRNAIATLVRVRYHIGAASTALCRGCSCTPARGLMSGATPQGFCSGALGSRDLQISTLLQDWGSRRELTVAHSTFAIHNIHSQTPYPVVQIVPAEVQRIAPVLSDKGAMFYSITVSCVSSISGCLLPHRIDPVYQSFPSLSVMDAVSHCRAVQRACQTPSTIHWPLN